MNKLRKKIYWTLFIILTLFVISILFIFGFQNYNQEKRSIEQNLLRMNNGIDKSPHNKGEFLKDNNGVPMNDIIKEDSPRKFLDATVYTILLDDSNNIIEIISHTEDGLVKDNIKEAIEKILSSNKQSQTYIGNLYFADISYKYEKNNYIIVIDNEDIKERLISSFEIMLLLFSIAEIMIIIISKILSEWIIKPVEVSFNKQKQFIADASHELKTPLSVIMACAETLENNPKESKWLDNIKSESEKMSKLVISLLDLAKMENESDKQLYEEVDFSKLIEKSILPFESLAFEKNISLDYDIKNNINFACNSEEIRELLSILLDNAIKHSSKKGQIKISLKEEKDILLLEVSNKGNPIPKGEEEKIFERFYRGDKSRNRSENRYGLGLAIAKSIVTNHNGTITATSSDEYTTFKIILKKKNIKRKF